MTVWCHTAKSESKTEPGFVISTPDYVLDPIFSPFRALFFSKKTLMMPTMTIPMLGNRFPPSGNVWAKILFRLRYRTTLYEWNSQALRVVTHKHTHKKTKFEPSLRTGLSKARSKTGMIFQIYLHQLKCPGPLGHHFLVELVSQLNVSIDKIVIYTSIIFSPS